MDAATAQHARDTRQLEYERDRLSRLQLQLQDDLAKVEEHVRTLEENLAAAAAAVITANRERDEAQTEAAREAQVLAAEKARSTAELNATRDEYFQQVETERAALETAHGALAQQKADLATLRDELDAALVDIEKQTADALALQEQVGDLFMLNLMNHLFIYLLFSFK